MVWHDIVESFLRFHTTKVGDGDGAATGSPSPL